MKPLGIQFWGCGRIENCLTCLTGLSAQLMTPFHVRIGRWKGRVTYASAGRLMNLAISSARLLTPKCR